MKTKRRIWPGWYLVAAWILPAFGCSPGQAIASTQTTTVAARRQEAPVFHRETSDEIGERFATSVL